VKTGLIGVIGICLVALAVTGDSARGQNVPAPLAVSPASLDFGEHALGSESQPQTITISNPGNAAVALEDVLLSGMDFAEKNDCGKSLAPGASCTMQVSFKPVISGPRIGNVDITGLDSGSPHFVALTGTGE
jgi:hypothetical protein